LYGSNLRDFVAVGKRAAEICFRLEFCDTVCDEFSVEIHVTHTLNFARTQYDVDAEGLPEFGKIEHLVFLPAQVN
jgi:hypothetical protein